MPGVPMAMPSVTAMVLNSIGVPPAARMPAQACCGQLAQVQVAGRHVRPGVHHRDQRLGDVGVVQPGGAQHGARGGAVGAGFDGVAA